MARKALLLILLLASFACEFKAKEESGALIAGHQSVTNKFSVSVPASKSYIAGEDLVFTLTFPYEVTVSNTPRLQLTIGGSTEYADYTSGNGTKTLLFSYTVQSGDNDSNGIAVSSTLDLNGGSLIFTGTNGPDNCSTSLTVPSTSSVNVDAVTPGVSNVAAPSNGSYLVNMPMLFTVTMDEAVAVTGTPRLQLTIGSTTRYATYVSGTGTSTLYFRYTVVAADLDANGIVVASPIGLNGGTIADLAGNTATLTFTPPNTTAVLVDGNLPYVVSVTPPANGIYSTGNNLDFVFTFSEAVVVNATPTVALTVGATARTASYHSGSGTTQITFRHTVVNGDLDLNGIASASVFTYPGGAWIRDLASTNILNGFVMPSLTGVVIGENGPQISSFNITNSTYFIGQTLNITAVFDQTVIVNGTPRIPVTLNTGVVYATYVSGTGTANLTFSYTVENGVDDPNGVVVTSPMELNGGTIRSLAAINAILSFTQPSTPSVRISGIRPYVTSVTAPANGMYLTGQNMDFVVNVSENVNTGNNSNIWLNLTIGATPVTAAYLSGSGTNALTFRYTVTGAVADTDGITVGTLTVNSPGFIADGGPSANAATVTFTPPNTSAVLVNAVSPTISLVTPPGNATYILNQQLDFSVQFSENVTVTGTPTIPVTIGATSRTASYVSGSGSNTLVFRYTVPLNDSDTDGIASASPIALNGGTINSALGVAATLTFTPPATTSVLVDANIPDVTTVVVPPNSLYDTDDVSWTFTATFDQTVTVATASPRIVLNIGGTTRYATYTTGSGTNTLTFVHTINSADIDLDGIAIGNSGSLDLNGATIRDANGNDAALSLGSPNVSGIYLTYPGMVGWWDMDDSSTVTTATCGVQTCAASVTDRTGSGYDITQTGTAQPQYIASGFGTGNTAYLRFDNANDLMDVSTSIPTVRTMIFVIQTESTMTTQDIFSSSAGGGNARVQISAAGNLSYGGTNLAAYSLNGAALSADSISGLAGMSASTNYILVVRFSTNETIATTQRLGSTNFGGRIAEVIIFNNGNALNDSELAPIINYLNAKHGVY